MLIYERRQYDFGFSDGSSSRFSDDMGTDEVAWETVPLLIARKVMSGSEQCAQGAVNAARGKFAQLQ